MPNGTFFLLYLISAGLKIQPTIKVEPTALICYEKVL